MRPIVIALLVAAVVAACGPAASVPPVPTAVGSGPASVAATPVPAAPGPAASGVKAPAPSDASDERRSDGGGVEVVASWSTGDPLSLKITLDTHSVDLDKFDLARLAGIRLDGGDWAAPTAADVPKGGHHRAGTLTFGSVPAAAFAAARTIELRINEVAVPERLLRWER